MADYITYDSDYIPRAFPLHNKGAICWFNSLLQALLSIPSLNKIVTERDIDTHNRFSRSYQRVIDAALDGHDEMLAGCSSDLLLTMREQALVAGIDIGLGAGQECADLAFVKFIELLDDPRITALFSTTYEMRINCTGCDKRTSSVRDTTTRVQMFGKVATEADFRRYMMVHTSEHDFYRCECGHRMVKFARTEVLKMVREVIVVVFNKFARRETTPVPPTLRFPRAGGGYLDYRLVATINHSGTAQSGHYHASVLRHGQWFKADDSVISAGSPTALPGTFMAFYHMTE